MNQSSPDFHFLFTVFLYSVFLSLFLVFIYFAPSPYRHQFFQIQKQDQLYFKGSQPLIAFIHQKNGNLTNVFDGAGAPNINLTRLPKDINTIETWKRVDLLFQLSSAIA